MCIRDSLATALLATSSSAWGNDAPSPAASPEVHASETQEAPKTVDELLARLKKMQGLSARFEERKTIALLAAPLVNRGHVRFHPPQHLLRSVEEPSPSAVLLSGDDIWVSENGTFEHIDLHAHPAARSFAGSFRALLAADRPALDTHFALSLDVDEAGGWTLQLSPRTDAMKKLITKMTIRGSADKVRQLVIEEATGDLSDTRFFDVDTQYSHSAEEVERYFAVPHV
ncbi:MAG: outer membrane lipoprotein carrier protein LolA [Nannocystaceae bacterium]|nr:outer membrane lipoprotein carrier protein LolA [Nannocystaceae bacterium]